MNKNLILFTDFKIVYIHYQKKKSLLIKKKLWESLLIQD